ncbi:MAG: sulfotransferase-like domain-containing protein [Paracoccaceae bacterium]
MKIAMWSGPRNLSTALMYAFGCRTDFQAWDEPFYAAYLKETGIDHPMRKEVLAMHETDANVVSKCIQETGGNVFLKLMGFHMCPGFPFDWAEDCVHAHLIRHPALVVASYVAKREKPSLRDIGFEHQVALFEQFPGPVIDSATIRENPEKALNSLCSALDVPFTSDMLHWQKGAKPFDGVWAQHWYNAVHQATGFSGVEKALPELHGSAAALVEQALPFYERLRAKAIT